MINLNETELKKSSIAYSFDILIYFYPTESNTVRKLTINVFFECFHKSLGKHCPLSINNNYVHN